MSFMIFPYKIKYEGSYYSAGQRVNIPEDDVERMKKNFEGREIEVKRGRPPKSQEPVV